MRSCVRNAWMVAFLVLSGLVDGNPAAQSSFVAIDLGTFGGTFSRAIAINDAGQVVGYSQLREDRATHVFSWTAVGGMRDLGTLGGSFSTADAVSDSGQVVGQSSVIDEAVYHAFSWTEAGGMVDLGSLGGFASAAAAVNGAGQVVGESFTAAGTRHAFLVEPAGGHARPRDTRRR